MEVNETERPPLGLMPEWRHKELRLDEINAAMVRYHKAQKAIPVEWAKEQLELGLWLRSRRDNVTYPDHEFIVVGAKEICVFHSFQTWVNKGASWLGGRTKTRHDTILCLDKNGNVCKIGEDFMAARDNDLFPVTAYLLTRTIDAVK